MESHDWASPLKRKMALYRGELPVATTASPYDFKPDESAYPFTSPLLDRTTTNAALIQHLLNTAIVFANNGFSELSYLQVVDGVAGQ